MDRIPLVVCRMKFNSYLVKQKTVSLGNIRLGLFFLRCFLVGDLTASLAGSGFTEAEQVRTIINLRNYFCILQLREINTFN